MKRQLLTTILTLSMSLIGGPSLAAEHQAGLMRWSFEYQQKTVPALVWFPASGSETTLPFGPFRPKAVTDAQLTTGTHPLVVISHGTGGSNIGHHPIGAALARAGFIVAALTHPGDNYQDRSLVTHADYFAERPRQLSAFLDALLADKQISDHVDHKRIAAIGHSIGGYTVAALLGGSPDRESLIKHCQAVTDDPSCGYRDPQRGVSQPANTVKTGPLVRPTGAMTVDVDTRLQAALLLAPFGRVIATGNRLNAQVPVHIIAAEHDEILPHQYHLGHLKRVAPHATHEFAGGAGHFSFLAPIDPAWKARLGEVALDPDGFNRESYQEQLAQTVVQWFRTTMRHHR